MTHFLNIYLKVTLENGTQLHWVKALSKIIMQIPIQSWVKSIKPLLPLSLDGLPTAGGSRLKTLFRRSNTARSVYRHPRPPLGCEPCVPLCWAPPRTGQRHGTAFETFHIWRRTSAVFSINTTVHQNYKTSLLSDGCQTRRFFDLTFPLHSKVYSIESEKKLC